MAPITLIAMKDIATGIPTNSRTVEPPSSSSEAICQDITRGSSGALTVSSCGHRVVAQADLGHGKPVHAEDEFDAEQDKANRQWRKGPPFRRDQCLDDDRAGRITRHGDEGPVPDEVATAEQTDDIADPFQHPGNAR